MTSRLSHCVEYDGGVVRVALTGEIDLDVADELYGCLVSAARQWPGVALRIDMCAVTFIDSSGIRTFVRARDHVLAGGGDVRLVNVADVASRVLRVTGVYSYLCGEDDPD